MSYILQAADIDRKGNIVVTSWDTDAPEEGWVTGGFICWDALSTKQQVRKLARAVFCGEMSFQPSCEDLLARAARAAEAEVGTWAKHPDEERDDAQDRFVEVFACAAGLGVTLVAETY